MNDGAEPLYEILANNLWNKVVQRASGYLKETE
jgi:hypothetical protein